MKKFMKILSLVLAIAMCVSIFAACGKKTDDNGGNDPTQQTEKGPESVAELIDLSSKAMKDNKNLSLGMKLGFNLNMNTEMEGVVMSMKVPMNIAANFDIVDKYMHGKMDINADANITVEFDGEKETSEENIKESAEMYYVLNDDGKTAIVYTKDSADGNWYFEEQNVEEITNNLLDLSKNNDLFAKAELKKDGDNYVVTMKLADVLGSEAMGNLLEKGEGLDDMEMDMDLNPADLAAAVGDATMTYIFNKDYYLVSITTGDVKLDLSKVVTDENSNDLANIGFDPKDMEISMNVEITLGKFGEIKDADVKVPDKVKDNAQEADDEPFFDEDYPSEDDNKPVVDDGKVSDDWTDLDIMIDGVVYKFPYDYEKLQSNGWSFDMAEYGYEDGYILNKGDQTYSTIEMHNETYGYNYDSFLIYCGFQNFGKKPADITKCDLWSIELNAMSGFEKIENCPTVAIAKGITFGSTEAEVIAAFGECHDIYDAGEYGYKTYEYNDNYERYLTITIFEDYGVTSIEMQSYGD